MAPNLGYICDTVFLAAPNGSVKIPETGLQEKRGLREVCVSTRKPHMLEWGPIWRQHT